MGLSDLTCTGDRSNNEENIRQFFGLSEEDELPIIDDGCMLLVDNIFIFPILNTPVAIIRGHCVLMDYDKYCEYYYYGLSASYSMVPYDYQEVKGYVYGVESVDDYSGFFFGCSEANSLDCKGTSIALNGVTAVIIAGEALVPSLGGSITYFISLFDDWQYGEVSITWHESNASKVSNQRISHVV